MKIRWKLLSYLLIVIQVMVSCSPNHSAIIGTYTFIHSESIIDTLIISRNAYFEQRIYYAQGEENVPVNRGVWKYKDGRILFKHFIAHEGEAYSKNRIDAAMLMDVSFPVYRRWNKCYIGHNEEKNSFEYEQIH